MYQYDTLGNRCYTTYYTRNTPIVVPVGNVVEQLDSAYNVLTYSYDDHFVYKINANNIIKREFVHNSEGYIRYGNDGVNFYPYYYIKDYLGNVRETYVCLTQTSSQCIQRMQYYPSGMPWNDNYQASQQPYKYGGKEFVEMHGLDEYDSEARWYYPALMRTTTQDPLAEKYYDISPFAWCANNPVNLVDPDGKHISVIDNRDSTYTVVNGVLKFGFTIYEGIEPPISQWAQNFGYYYGYYEFLKYYTYYGNKIYGLMDKKLNNITTNKKRVCLFRHTLFFISIHSTT